MKQRFFLLLCLGVLFTFTSCEKDDDVDITGPIVGEYVGTYDTDKIDEVTSFTVVVTKKDNDEIRIKPKSGDAFEEFDVEMDKVNGSQIKSEDDEDESVTFDIGTVVSLQFSFKDDDTLHSFTGVRK